jgi:CRISPR-associated endonuclease/helicase Cas3
MEYIAHVRKSDGQTQTVGEHLLGVSKRAGVYAAKIGLGTFAEFQGLLHDLGKYAKAFCNYIMSAAGMLDPDADDYVDAGGLRGKIDHSTAGAQYSFAALSAKGKAGEIAGAMAALCLASHHSGLIDSVAPDGTDNLSRRLAKSDHLTHLKEALGNIDPQVRERLEQLANDHGAVNSRFGRGRGGHRAKGDEEENGGGEYGVDRVVPARIDTEGYRSCVRCNEGE